MAVTLLSGDLATEIINQAQIKVEKWDAVVELEPNNRPFLTLILRLWPEWSDEEKLFFVRILLGDVSEKEWLAHMGEHGEAPLRCGRFLPFTATAHVLAGPLEPDRPKLNPGDLLRIEDSGEAVKVKRVDEYSVAVQRGKAVGSERRESKTGEFYVIGSTLLDEPLAAMAK